MRDEKERTFLRKIPGFRSGTPWKMVVAAVFYVMFIVALIDVISEGPTPQNTDIEKPVTSSQKEPTLNWPTADITEENINKVLASDTDVDPISMDIEFPNNISKVEIIDIGDGKKNVWIYYAMGSVWDETDLVKRAGGTAIFAGNILYQNPNVEDVALFAQGEFTDSYGNTSLDTAVKIIMNKALADQVDWKGLADRHTTDPGNIYRIVDIYSIHPGVLSRIKASEIDL